MKIDKFFKEGEYTYTEQDGVVKVEPVEYRLSFIKSGVDSLTLTLLRSIGRYVADSYSCYINDIHVGFLVKVWDERKDRYRKYYIRSIHNKHLHHIHNGYPMSKLIYNKLIDDFNSYLIVYIKEKEILVSKPKDWKLHSKYVSNNAEGQQVLPLEKWWKCIKKGE